MRIKVVGFVGIFAFGVALSVYYWNSGYIKVTEATPKLKLKKEVKTMNDDGKPKRRLPQVIGLGVKKCGTAALRTFLRRHSKVLMSTVSEAHFFDANSTFKKGKDYYRSVMPVTESDQWTMEMTPKYFITPYVPERIKKFYGKTDASELKFIVILCNPVDRILSEYVHTHLSMKQFGLETRVQEYGSVSDYVKKVLPEVQSKMKKIGAEAVINGSREFIDFIYEKPERTLITNGIFAMHIKRWYSYYKPSQILAVSGDVLIKRPWEVLLEVQDFLGIERTITKDKFTFNKEKGFYCVDKCLGAGKGRSRIQDPEKLKFLPLTADTRKMLVEFFAPYSEVLFSLLGKRLEWYI